MGRPIIIKALKDGLDVLAANPVIFAPAFVLVLVNAYILERISELPAAILTLLRYHTIEMPEINATLERLACAASASFCNGAGNVDTNNIGIMLAFALFALLFTVFMIGLLTKLIYDAKILRASIPKVAKAIARKYKTLLAAGLLIFVISFAVLPALFFLFLLFLPGNLGLLPGVCLTLIWLFLLVKICFYVHAIIFDKEGAISSFKNSWGLTEGKLRKIAGLFLAVEVAVTLMIYLISAILAAGSLTYFIVNSLAMSFGISLLLSAVTMAYIQLREAPSSTEEYGAGP